jgi:membrane protease YdiL (CAAX protease family)
MPWADWAALISLLLYLTAIVLCAFRQLRTATPLSWIALGCAAASGTMGLWPALAFAAIQLWRDLDPRPNLPRGLLFTSFMLLALFRIIPGIGSLTIQVPTAPSHPFSISWTVVVVAWLVFSGITRNPPTILDGKRPWATLLTLGVPTGILAALVNASFRWQGPLDLPLSAGWIFGWAVLDLFFISVSDEALYRGSIMALILRIFGNTIPGWSVALLSASSLFALQHHVVAGDPFLGSFAVGMLFGFCYFFSGFLEASMIAHFTCDLLLLVWGALGTTGS